MTNHYKGDKFMPKSNPIYYLFDSRHLDEHILIYWPINQNIARDLILQINQVFNQLYNMPLRINSWNNILTYMFHVVNFAEVLPATNESLINTSQMYDFSGPETPAIIFRQAEDLEGDTDPKDLPTLVTTIDVAKFANVLPEKEYLKPEQLNWLTAFFTGKIKFNNQHQLIVPNQEQHSQAQAPHDTPEGPEHQLIQNHSNAPVKSQNESKTSSSASKQYSISELAQIVNISPSSVRQQLKRHHVSSVATGKHRAKLYDQNALTILQNYYHNKK